eukprot:TRINITY_DN816_c0_g1_i1.p1 TRINITY_DN816_c0_g1~~TRINITY_DN816_c0_g1_i1.p1  ORF type:complete len:228 (-),score=74.17 TRINITY_DN816_c0_g1_i1:37-720(-)
MARFFAIALVASFLICSNVDARGGVVEIDDISADLIVDGSKPTLVSFQEYGYKTPENFDKVASELKGNGVLVTKIDCKQNEETCKKYNADPAHPVVQYFAKGAKTGVVYDGALEGDAIIEWTKISMNPKLQQIKDLAVEFVAKIAERETILKSVEKIVDALEGVDKEYATHFVPSMKKIIEKGDSYVTAEKDRLQGLINNKSTAEKKKAEFQRRLNTLNTFAAKMEL